MPREESKYRRLGWVERVDPKALADALWEIGIDARVFATPNGDRVWGVSYGIPDGDSERMKLPEEVMSGIPSIVPEC